MATCSPQPTPAATSSLTELSGWASQWLKKADHWRRTAATQKQSSAEAAIVKSLKEAVKDLPKGRPEDSGFMGFWFDLGGPDGGQRAFINFGDWATREEIDDWKDVGTP